MADAVPGGGRRLQRVQTILVGLALFGVIVEACFIVYLYNKILNLPLPCTTASHQPSGNIMGQVGDEGETKATPSGPTRTTEIQWKPSAHLICSQHGVKNGVVQWTHNMGDAFQHHVNYTDNRLVIMIEGHYYVYSKVQLNPEESCSTLKHTVMRDTKAYQNVPLELMKALRYPCGSNRAASTKNQRENQRENQRAPGGDSFLGGVFQLNAGDAIYVKLEGGEMRDLGTTDTFMGAFMI